MNLPDGISSIGINAFNSFTNLTGTIHLENVPKIGTSAFMGCNKITSVILGEGLTVLRVNTFCDCSELVSIVIPTSLETVEAFAFARTNALKHILYKGNADQKAAISIDNAYNFNSPFINASWHFDYIPRDGVLIYGSCGDNLTWELDDDCNLTISGTGAMTDYSEESPAPWHFALTVFGKEIPSVTLPEGLTHIGDYAFYDCTGLTSVAIPNSVTSIGANAFAYCDNLTDMTIQDSVTSIGDDAFPAEIVIYGIYNSAAHQYAKDYGNPFKPICEKGSGHQWNDGKITPAATCTKDGVKTYTCTVCQATKTEAVAAIGHSYGAWAKLDNTQHQRVCANDKTHVEKENHAWDSGTVTAAATCTEDGVTSFTCTVCGATKTETIPATGHSYGVWEKLDDERHQRVCENDSTHVETENHVWDDGICTADVTCTEDGEDTYLCIFCDAVKTISYPATGHSYGAWEKLDEAQHQRVCANDAAHVETENHAWDEGTVTTEPTDKAEGVKTFTCTVCGAEKTEVIPRTEPAFIIGDVDGDGKITSADARLALRASVGLKEKGDVTPGSAGYLAADVNADGKVGSDDARLILRASVGLEDASKFGKKA